VRFVASNELRHLRELTGVFRSRLCGTFLFGLLALIGLAVGPWNRNRALTEIVLWAYAVTAYLSLGSVYHFWERYAVALIPLLVLWAARATTLVWRGIPIVLTAVFLAALLFSNRERFTDDSLTVAERIAGMRLGVSVPAGARILSISDQSVYYARGVWSMLPYAPDNAVALRYVERVAPDYVVLNREYAGERPYVVAWLEHGIPDRRAVLVQTIGAPGAPTLAVYRWQH
jgi:hypothetical protein